MTDLRWAGSSGRIAAYAVVLIASTVGFPVAAAGAAAAPVPSCLGEPATIVADGPVTTGTSGPDVIVGRTDFDQIDPGGGRDLVCSRGGSASVDGGAPGSANTLDGDDILYRGQSGVTVDLRATSDSRGNQIQGLESVGGTQARDVIIGTSGVNELFGGGGRDDIRGLEGVDQIAITGRKQTWSGVAHLIGGPGGDHFYVKTRGPLVILGGAGNDFLDGGNGPDRLNGGRGADFLAGDGGADLLRGGRGADRLVAGYGDDTMSGGPGRDSWLNFDSYFGSAPGRVTTVRIGAGTVRDKVGDVVFHDRLAGIEVYRGARDVEHVYGSAGHDVVDTRGTEGHLVDLIYGRGGNDHLVAPRHGRIDGGAGRDYCRAQRVSRCER
jgi:Ca2+-binding RTX toxin-like protein